MAAIHAIFEPNILGFQKNFSSLMTNHPPVQDYHPDTPLHRCQVSVFKFQISSAALLPTIDVTLTSKSESV